MNWLNAIEDVKVLQPFKDQAYHSLLRIFKGLAMLYLYARVFVKFKNHCYNLYASLKLHHIYIELDTYSIYWMLNVYT